MNRYLESMKVICIKDGDGTLHSTGAAAKELTPGKVYHSARALWGHSTPYVEHEEWCKTCDIPVINDEGYLAFYDRTILVPLVEWREKRIKELGI